MRKPKFSQFYFSQKEYEGWTLVDETRLVGVGADASRDEVTQMADVGVGVDVHTGAVVGRLHHRVVHVQTHLPGSRRLSDAAHAQPPHACTSFEQDTE